MRDATNKDLKEGDAIVFIPPFKRTLQRGWVHSFTEYKVKIEFVTGLTTVNYCYREPGCIAKVDG